MTTAPKGFEFEQPILDIEARLRELDAMTQPSEDQQEEAKQLRRRWTESTREIYGKLSPWEVVQVSRHKDRPYTKDYLNLAFDEFIELHGDKFYGDDRAMLTGFAKLGRRKVMVIGHQKGRTFKERAACHFGCAHPEGYRKAMAKMKMAEKYNLPIIAFIDTPGAYPGIGAEERGQAQVIAESMFLMATLPVPIVCAVIGEGGSGGALGIGVGDRVAVLEHAYYSVISPEGCAGILWKSVEFKADAARALRFRSRDLKEFGVIDAVIEEPAGGAHRHPRQMATRLKTWLVRSLRSLVDQPAETLVAERYEKFRRMGVFLEEAAS
jgi:acetyl-CoA carboxylase carboxyl transferase subunit alpha